MPVATHGMPVFTSARGDLHEVSIRLGFRHDHESTIGKMGGDGADIDRGYPLLWRERECRASRRDEKISLPVHDEQRSRSQPGCSPCASCRSGYCIHWSRTDAGVARRRAGCRVEAGVTWPLASSLPVLSRDGVEEDAVDDFSVGAVDTDLRVMFVSVATHHGQMLHSEPPRQASLACRVRG
jgi:hypothetical protein